MKLSDAPEAENRRRAASKRAPACTEPRRSRPMVKALVSANVRRTPQFHPTVQNARKGRAIFVEVLYEFLSLLFRFYHDRRGFLPDRAQSRSGSGSVRQGRLTAARKDQPFLRRKLHPRFHPEKRNRSLHCGACADRQTLGRRSGITLR